MIYRAEQSSIISKSSAKWLWMEFSKRGWRKAEPGFVRPDRATRFEDLLASAVAEKHLNWGNASELLRVPASDLDSRMRLALGSNFDPELEGDERQDGDGLRLYTFPALKSVGRGISGATERPRPVTRTQTRIAHSRSFMLAQSNQQRHCKWPRPGSQSDSARKTTICSAASILRPVTPSINTCAFPPTFHASLRDGTTSAIAMIHRESIHHYMMTKRKNGQWVTFDGAHNRLPTLTEDSLSAEEWSYLQSIYDALFVADDIGSGQSGARHRPGKVGRQ